MGHLSPYSTEELNKKSLHDIVKFVDRKHQPLKNVYPTRHPKSAFKLNRKGAQIKPEIIAGVGIRQPTASQEISSGQRSFKSS